MSDKSEKSNEHPKQPNEREADLDTGLSTQINETYKRLEKRVTKLEDRMDALDTKPH